MIKGSEPAELKFNQSVGKQMEGALNEVHKFMEVRHNGWPYGIRVEMAPIDPNPARLQPISITVPIYMHRSAELKYED